jgi:mannitol-specific phosphotransferase system IIBC component
MNPEMMKGQIRTLLVAVGGLIAGWFMSKGWLSQETWAAIVASPVTPALVTVAAGFIWSALTHTEKNAVAVVGAIALQPDSPVKGVITEPTIAGRELAKSIPLDTVVSAGTHEAATIARPAG